jgi:hypothetical protein
LRNDSRGLCAPLHAKDLQSLADALIDGVRRNLKLGSDFLRRQMLPDEKEAVELPST